MAFQYLIPPCYISFTHPSTPLNFTHLSPLLFALSVFFLLLLKHPVPIHPPLLFEPPFFFLSFPFLTLSDYLIHLHFISSTHFNLYISTRLHSPLQSTLITIYYFFSLHMFSIPTPPPRLCGNIFLDHTPPLYHPFFQCPSSTPFFLTLTQPQTTALLSTLL